MEPGTRRRKGRPRKGNEPQEGLLVYARGRVGVIRTVHRHILHTDTVTQQPVRVTLHNPLYEVEFTPSKRTSTRSGTRCRKVQRARLFSDEFAWVEASPKKR